MKRKKLNSQLKLDYTTTLVVSIICLVIASFAILGVASISKKINEQSDHKKPLQVTNLTYCNGEKLDLFVPQSSTSVPLVIYIHGGGWQYGSKVGGSFGLIKPLVQSNFAVASINYRLSGNAKFPAQINDVFCAVRYLRQNAQQFNINSTKIGVVGISAGAHLAVLAGNSSDQKMFTTGPYQDQSSVIQSVVGINGMYNLESSGLKEETNQNITKLLDGSKFTKKAASPSTYISQYDPPQLLIYGLKDKTVLPSQTLEYASSAKSNGLTINTLAVERAGHNLEPYFAFTTVPTRENITQMIIDFYKKQLEI